MKPLSMYALLLLALGLPGTASAQGRSPFPDHWLTADSLAALVGLNNGQLNRVSDAYQAVNQVLADATRRRLELRAQNEGRRASQMSDAEREALKSQLVAIRTEYEGRESDLEQRLATLRSLLTAQQQARFDALPKPRLIPQS